MRISDWSSDVCSSDLRRRSGLVDLRIVMTGALEHDRADRRARTMRAAEVGQQLEVAFAALVAEPIGRSCGMGAGQRLDDTAGADRLDAQHIADVYRFIARVIVGMGQLELDLVRAGAGNRSEERKSTRLNSSP